MLSPEHLVLIRSLQDLSQQELANRIGCTKSYISMLENRKQPITEELYKKWVDAIYGLYDVRTLENKDEDNINNDIDNDIEKKKGKKGAKSANKSNKG